MYMSLFVSFFIGPDCSPVSPFRLKSVFIQGNFLPVVASLLSLLHPLLFSPSAVSIVWIPGLLNLFAKSLSFSLMIYTVWVSTVVDGISSTWMSFSSFTELFTLKISFVFSWGKPFGAVVESPYILLVGGFSSFFLSPPEQFYFYTRETLYIRVLCKRCLIWVGCLLFLFLAAEPP